MCTAIFRLGGARGHPHHVGYKQIIYIEQQNTFFLSLSLPTFKPLSRKWSDFVDRRKFVQSIILVLVFKKELNLGLFMKFVL